MNLTFVCFQEEEAKDQEILNEPEIEIPDKPEEFNKEQARKDIIAKAKEIRRRPGEPKLYPEVTSTQPITEASKCPRSGSHSLTLFYFTQFMSHVCVVQSFNTCEELMEMNCFCRGEQQRRNDVSKCEMFLKVLFNNKEVSRTSSK